MAFHRCKLHGRLRISYDHLADHDQLSLVENTAKPVNKIPLNGLFSQHMTSSPLIEVNDLVKDYDSFRAVDQLSFRVHTGDVYGFLGQNGAGKSTTMRMLLTLIAPTSGSIKLFGLDLQRHRAEVLRQVGAVIERPDLYKYLSAYENLSIFARMSGVRPTRKLLMDQLDLVGLADRAHSKVRTFSQGMKQRLGIGVALVHNPALILLDEPTNGLDPQGIADIRHLILRLAREMGKTVVVSSHLLSEIELVASRMLIIHHGQKKVEGEVSALLDPTHTLVEIRAVDPQRARTVLADSPWKALLQPQADLRLEMNRADVPQLISYLTEAGIGLQEVNASHSLENYFLSLTTQSGHVEPFTN